MIKRFCDCCGAVLDKRNTAPTNEGGIERLQAKVKKGGKVLLQVEVITAKGSTWNDGEFCKYCIIDAINQLDDRPKQA